MQSNGILSIATAQVLLALIGCGPYILTTHKKASYPDVVEAAVIQRIILVGDAGDPSAEKTLEDVTKRASNKKLKDVTTIFFLGDNIYGDGLPAGVNPEACKKSEEWKECKECKEWKRVKPYLDAQIKVVKDSGVKGIFILGNHDWDSAGKRGLARGRAQAEYVTKELGDGAFLSKEGCPGPEPYTFGEIRVIALDTQWLLHKWDDKWDVSCKKNGTAVKYTSNDTVYADLEKLLATDAKKPTIVVAHHPIKTHGHHGYRYHWRHLIFPVTLVNEAPHWILTPLWWPPPSLRWWPIPLVGGLVPLFKGPSEQDTLHPDNMTMVDKLNKAMTSHKGPLVYAAGHDHGLQVMTAEDTVEDIAEKNNHYALVSGGASEKKITFIKKGKDKIMSHKHTGYMELDYIQTEERYQLILLVFDTGKPDPVFLMPIE
jgi:hypothetical protein